MTFFEVVEKNSKQPMPGLSEDAFRVSKVLAKSPMFCAQRIQTWDDVLSWLSAFKHGQEKEVVGVMRELFDSWQLYLEWFNTFGPGSMH